MIIQLKNTDSIIFYCVSFLMFRMFRDPRGGSESLTRWDRYDNIIISFCELVKESSI